MAKHSTSRPRRRGAPSGGRGVSPLLRHRRWWAQPAVLRPHLSAAKAAHPLNTQLVPALGSTVIKGSCRRTCLELDLQQSLARKLFPTIMHGVGGFAEAGAQPPFRHRIYLDHVPRPSNAWALQTGF